MAIVIKRPLVVFDTETTGIDTENDRIVEFAACKIYPDNSMTEYVTKINPGIPIPPGATAIHKITDADVANEAKMGDVVATINKGLSTEKTFTKAQVLRNSLRACDLAGHNVRFDVRILTAEFERHGITDFPEPGMLMLDTYENESRLFPRDLSTLVQKYTKKPLENAHGAMADTKGCLDVFLHQLELEAPDTTLEELASKLPINNRFDLAGWIKVGDDDIPVWSWGKNKGLPIMDDIEYLKWAVSDKDKTPPKETKRQIRIYVKWHNEQIAAQENVNPQS